MSLLHNVFTYGAVLFSVFSALEYEAKAEASLGESSE